MISGFGSQGFGPFKGLAMRSASALQFPVTKRAMASSAVFLLGFPVEVLGVSCQKPAWLSCEGLLSMCERKLEGGTKACERTTCSFLFEPHLLFKRTLERGGASKASGNKYAGKRVVCFNMLRPPLKP